MSWGSQQLRMYRRLRRDGATMMKAAVESGLSVAEARLTDAADLANPPPPEAFEPLAEIPPAAPAPAAAVAAPQKEKTMGRAKKQQSQVEEVIKPDFDLAVRIYREDIKPAQARVGEFAQEQSTAYKAIKKSAHIQPAAAKAAFKLDGMEPSKRDDYLRSFSGLLQKLGIFMPVDLVDVAEGKGSAGASVVPTGERPRPKLATVPTGPAGDTDLADGADQTGAADNAAARVEADADNDSDDTDDVIAAE